MHLRSLSFQKSAVLACAAAVCSGQEVRFTPAAALKAEWARTPPALAPAEVEAEDRARLDLALRRIGAPGEPTGLLAGTRDTVGARA